MKKLLRNKLALMLATLRKKRKYFCEVEYLESTGTQWFDTGAKGNLNTKIEAKVYSQKVSGTESGYCIAGDFTTSTKAITMPFNFVSGGLYSRFGDKSITSGIQQANGTYTFAVDKEGYYVDGIKIADFNTTTSFTTDSNIMLFGFTGLGRNYLVGKIYYCKIWDNGTLVRDFIPVLDWNYTPCMYDKVSGQLFYNQGTDDFQYGREIHYVDYLESTGTQYIDTGYASNNIYANSSCEVICETLDSSNRVVGCGGLSDNNKNMSLSFSGGGYIVGLYGNRWTSDIFAYSTNTKYKIKFEVSTSQQKLYVNNNLIDTTAYSWESSNNYPLRLFKTNADTYTKPTKIYSFKLWISDSLVRDYIPAIDENGVGFMFDKVTHTCFLNAGTGAFKYPARQVEYISSTGTQYINTGFKPNQNTKLESVVKYNGVYPACVCACRWSQSPNYDTFGQYAESTKVYAYWGRYSLGQFLGISRTDFDYTKFFKYTQNKNVLTYEGLEAQPTQTHTFDNIDFTSTTNLTLLFFNSSSSFATKGATIKYFKIWDDENMVRDFIPVYKDGAIGMYDKLNDVMYNNAGSGTFTAGKIIESEYE